MPEVSPGGLRVVRCVHSSRVQDLLLAWGGFKALDLRQPSVEREDGNPTGSCYLLISFKFIYGESQSSSGSFGSDWLPAARHHSGSQDHSALLAVGLLTTTAKDLKEGSQGLGLVYALLSVIFNSKLIAQIKPTVK